MTKLILKREHGNLTINKMSNNFKIVFLAVFILVLHTQNGNAQGGNDMLSQIKIKNQQAMIAFQSGQFSQAIILLKEAESIAVQYGMSDAISRTSLNIAIVEISGNMDNAAGLEYFKKAFCINLNLGISSYYKTPEIEALMNLAKKQVQTPGACGDTAAQTSYAPSQTTPRTTKRVTGSASKARSMTGLIRHKPILQQVRLTPIPIYADVNPGASATKVVLYYRTLGERIFQQIAMNALGEIGYAASIGCDVMQTFDPSGIEYYIAVLGQGNKLLGTSGTENQPHTVSMVQFISGSPPSFPDSPPPPKCQAECPPWNLQCNKGCKQMGDLCDSNSECCSGMACIHEACTPAEGGGDFGSKKGGKKILRITGSFGTGFGFVGKTDEAPYSKAYEPEPGINGLYYKDNVNIGAGMAWSKLHFRLGAMYYLSPKFQIGATFRGALPGELSKYKDNVSVLGASGILNMSFNFLEKKSFQLSAIAGLGAGRNYHRIPFDDCSEKEIFTVEGNDYIKCSNEKPRATAENKYFRKAGLFIVEAGVEGHYWFGDLFGVNFGVIMDMYLGDFALNFDIQAGPTIRF